jgi:hypothetical protein
LIDLIVFNAGCTFASYQAIAQHFDALSVAAARRTHAASCLNARAPRFLSMFNVQRFCLLC